MSMKPSEYVCGMIVLLCLAVMSAFCLLGMRYAASRHALQIKLLERELGKLQAFDLRMDLYLAHWQGQQRAICANRSTRRVLWLRNNSRLPMGMSLAYNR